MWIQPTLGRLGTAVHCPYCAELLVRISMRTVDWQPDVTGWDCLYCGWYMRHANESWCSLYDEEQDWQVTLETLAVDDAAVGEEELRAAIKGRPTLAMGLSPRRFEELVHGVFQDLGYESTLTAKSGDGGRDLILFDNRKGKPAIVEVKRYGSKVGVELVRQLRGVQLRDDMPTAILVSAMGFTSGAIAEAHHPVPQNYGFELQLSTIAELLQSLNPEQKSLDELLDAAADRSAWRGRFAQEFGLTDNGGKLRNPVLESGSDKTLIAGLWTR